jgi:hypothetical protein
VFCFRLDDCELGELATLESIQKQLELVDRRQLQIQLGFS